MTTPENSLVNSSENVLDIFVSHDGILCSISDDNKKVILRQDLSLPINAKTDMRTVVDFFNQPELKVLGDNVNIYIENSVYQLVPSELYREDDAQKLFEIVYGNSENEIIKYSVLPKWNLHLAYQIPEKLGVFFTERYPEVELKHIVFDLLKTFIHKTEDAVYLNVRKNAIDLSLVKDNRLQLLNSFDVKTDEDICFYTMNVYEQLNLNIENLKLKIRKNNIVNLSTVVLLKQYISVVEA